ncbi:glycosyltransferase [Halopseudomonas laoshanensis]|uniref:Glycosyltransferase n=1 Tax=Halopseudomonas laoshanensis TaxID=2268758 RepID=A0A7V7GR53_9GAMM|nr:WecB/TagA/CpsF family glycosyltransferase [Halopseudomonas laoshanensis]KAA0691296.1 glycosyltransferase [Halopseudomonas laoshanensis]
MKAFDIDFYTGSKEELLRQIFPACQQPFSYIVTPNVNHIVQLEHDQKLTEAYAMASHRICDSRVLLPILGLFGVKPVEAIPGSTLTADLMEVAAEQQWTVTVVGCEADNMALLREKYPGITFHHTYPPMGFIKDEAAIGRCLDFVVAHPGQLVVLALGCPTQEIIAARIFETGEARGVGLCVGGSLNFLAGSVKRAPEWVQNLSLEWLHRICAEPQRLLGRYAHDARRFIPILIRHLRT